MIDSGNTQARRIGLSPRVHETNAINQWIRWMGFKTPPEFHKRKVMARVEERCIAVCEDGEAMAEEFADLRACMTPDGVMFLTPEQATHIGLAEAPHVVFVEVENTNPMSQQKICDYLDVYYSIYLTDWDFALLVIDRYGYRWIDMIELQLRMMESTESLADGEPAVRFEKRH